MVYTLPPPKLLPPHAWCPQKLFCNNPLPPPGRHLHVAPHAFVLFLTRLTSPHLSLPPQLITVPWPKLKVELTWTYIEGVIHKSPNWRFHPVRDGLLLFHRAPAQMKGEVKKTIFTFRSNVFTLLQAMTKNNIVPRIDVGLALLCRWIIYL
jgi:hypothetical protein